MRNETVYTAEFWDFLPKKTNNLQIVLLETQGGEDP